MTQFAVLHIDKNKGSQIGLSKHISRENVPSNADPSRLHLNQTPIGTKNQMQDIKDRIQEGVIQKKAIRKDAVKAMQIILTGSHEQMKVIEEKGQLQSWTDQNIAWLNETFGKANVVNVTLHMDELTPHIHATVVPVTPDGRLCAKDFMTKYHLKNYQTSYGKAMAPFGLSRGMEGSRAKHQDVKQYYTKLNYELPKINKELEEKQETIKDLNDELPKINKEIEEKQETIRELNNEIRVNTPWKAVSGIVDGFAKRKENKDKEDEITALKKTIEELIIVRNKLQKELGKSKIDLYDAKKDIKSLQNEVDKSIKTGMQEAVNTINNLLSDKSEKSPYQFDLTKQDNRPVIEIKDKLQITRSPSVEKVIGKNKNLEL